MTESENVSPDPLNEEVAHLEEDADAMNRPDRAIPLPPGEDEEDDDGVGPITVLVP